MRAFSDFMQRIPVVRPLDPRHVRSRVDEILAAKGNDPAADVSALENEIDQLVYQLYGLTKEEIAVIEEATAEKR